MLGVGIGIQIGGGIAPVVAGGGGFVPPGPELWPADHNQVLFVDFNWDNLTSSYVADGTADANISALALSSIVPGTYRFQAEDLDQDGTIAVLGVAETSVPVSSESFDDGITMVWRADIVVSSVGSDILIFTDETGLPGLRVGNITVRRTA